MQFRQNLGTIQIYLDNIQTEVRANLDGIQTAFRQTVTDLDIIQTFLDHNQTYLDRIQSEFRYNLE